MTHSICHVLFCLCGASKREADIMESGVGIGGRCNSNLRYIADTAHCGKFPQEINSMILG